MMALGPGRRVLIVAALAILSLVGLVARESWERDHGTEAVLSMQGVDPRSLLSGDYVAINLQEPLPPGRGCPPGIGRGPTTGPARRVWIALAAEGDHMAAVGAAADRAGAARFAPLVVQGHATCSPPPPVDPGSTPLPGSVALDLGVDSFYVSQSEAQRISQLAAQCAIGAAPCPVAAIVSIGPDGRARLRGLLINGQRTTISL